MTLRALCLAVCLAACTPIPEFGPDAETGAAFPKLLPFDSLLQEGDALATPALVQSLNTRVAALRARANRLRRPVLTPTTRARLQAGVSQPF